MVDLGGAAEEADEPGAKLFEERADSGVALLVAEAVGFIELVHVCLHLGLRCRVSTTEPTSRSIRRQINSKGRLTRGLHDVSSCRSSRRAIAR